MQPFQNAAAGALVSLFCAAAPSLALAEGPADAAPEIVVTGAALPAAKSQSNYDAVTIGVARPRTPAMTISTAPAAIANVMPAACTAISATYSFRVMARALMGLEMRCLDASGKARWGLRR